MKKRDNKVGKILTTIGGVGLIASLFLMSTNITGSTIATKIGGSSILPLILFIASLITILVGVKEKIY